MLAPFSDAVIGTPATRFPSGTPAGAPADGQEAGPPVQAEQSGDPIDVTVIDQESSCTVRPGGLPAPEWVKVNV